MKIEFTDRDYFHFVKTLPLDGKYLNIYVLLGVVTHTCNPRYSGGGHQENQGLRPAQEKC
jgi:hypothetical protein